MLVLGGHFCEEGFQEDPGVRVFFASATNTRNTIKKHHTHKSISDEFSVNRISRVQYGSKRVCEYLHVSWVMYLSHVIIKVRGVKLSVVVEVFGSFLFVS